MVTDVMQPAQVRFEASVAGAWARDAKETLPVAMTATGRLIPGTFVEFGAAMSCVLSAYLAISHADGVVRLAPWLLKPIAPLAASSGLGDRAVRFRDAYMHLTDKAYRPAPPPPSGVSGTPQGQVVFSFGFASSGAYLYAPGDRTTQTRIHTRIDWHEVRAAVEAIERWSVDVLESGNDLDRQWLDFVGK